MLVKGDTPKGLDKYAQSFVNITRTVKPLNNSTPFTGPQESCGTRGALLSLAGTASLA